MWITGNSYFLYCTKVTDRKTFMMFCLGWVQKGSYFELIHNDLT